VIDEPTVNPTPDPHEAEQVLTPLVAPDTGPAREWAVASPPLITVHPDELPEGDSHLSITRTFCFADLCGFTAYTRSHGPHEAVAMLGDFRRITRSVAAKRGVRVAKWLGDGAMLVSTSAAAALSLGAHLIHYFSSRGVQIRVGAATGEALLFEGDDYVGEPVNLAAKLCAAAPAGEIFTVTDILSLPDWVTCIGDVTVRIRGVGPVSGVHRLMPSGLVDERGDELGRLNDDLNELALERREELTELSNELGEFGSGGSEPCAACWVRANRPSELASG
jgi:class 3 adenylate cyclase